MLYIFFLQENYLQLQYFDCLLNSVHDFLLQDYLIHYYLKQGLGIPSSKMLLGIPSYGRSVLFVNQTLTNFGDPHNGPGPKSQFTGKTGMMPYYEVSCTSFY